MTITDIIILIFVIAFLASIIYFRWIKKDESTLNCHCYRRKSCSIKFEELKTVLNNNEKESD